MTSLLPFQIQPTCSCETSEESVSQREILRFLGFPNDDGVVQGVEGVSMVVLSSRYPEHLTVVTLSDRREQRVSTS